MKQWIVLALRNILRSPARTLVTVLTVAMGTAALLLALGYIIATFQAIKFQTIFSGTGHLQIADEREFSSTPSHPLEFGLTPALRQSVDGVIGAQSASIVPLIDFSGLISTGEQTLIFSGLAVDPAIETQLYRAAKPIVRGTGLAMNQDKPYSIVLGAELARRLKVDIGGSVTVISAMSRGGYNAMDFEVVGLTSTNVPAVDLRYVSVPIQAAQELIGSDRIDRLVVFLEDEKAGTSLQARLKDSQLPVVSRTWLELSPFYRQIYTMYRAQFLFMGSVVALVVFLAVLNVMAIIVTERTREIGTLRALGIPAPVVRLVIAFEGGVLSLAGVLVGGLVAGAFSLLTRHIVIMMPPPPGYSSGYPLTVLWSWWGFLAVGSFMVAVGVLAAAFASRRAARMNIIMALGRG